MFSTGKNSSATVTETRFSCTREGLTIRGTEYRPEGEKLPAAIVCHGFMATEGAVRQYAAALARLGYAAYTFDFCGGSAEGGKSDGHTYDMSVLTEVRDLEAVLGYVKALPYIDDARLLLAGCSQGGFVSALTAAKHPDEIKRLILIYPALCIPDDARRGQMMFARFDPADIPEQFDCGPMRLGRCYPQAVLEMDPFAEIAPYRGEALLIHGTGDGLVLHSYSQRAYEAYLASCPEGMAPDKRAQLHLIPDAGHGFNEEEDALCIGYINHFAGELDF
jgi:pimeloyl-ACP methyl ester carboxylesterase